MEKENGEISTAVSFVEEHSVFLTEAILGKYHLRNGQPALFTLNDLTLVEICGRLEEIGHEQLENEARALIAILSAACWSSLSFFSMCGIPAKWKGRISTPLTLLKTKEIFPEFEIKDSSTFSYLFRKVEDVILEYSKPREERSEDVDEKLDNAVEIVTKYLKDYYENVDCIIGAGAFLSTHLPKNLDLAYSLCGFNGGMQSDIVGKYLFVNPYTVYWLITDISEFHKGSFAFRKNEISELSPVDLNRIPAIRTVHCKCYVSTTDIQSDSSVETKEMEAKIRNNFLYIKPYVYPNDFFTPFSCPTIIEYEPETDIEFSMLSPYGDYSPWLNPARIEKTTEINVNFFEFPLHNKKVPVILDTSAIDVSRFPLSRQGSVFYDIFIENRQIIIPRSVLWELKMRLKTEDRMKIEKALARLQALRSWGFIKELAIDGDYPQFFISDEKLKECYNDLKDCMTLDVAMKNHGILFTNDIDLVRMAILLGIVPVAFEGLEEDVCEVIRRNPWKLTVSEAIEKIREYGANQRNEFYENDDIRWTIKNLIQRGELTEQQIGRKSVLGYVGRKKKKSGI